MYISCISRVDKGNVFKFRRIFERMESVQRVNRYGLYGRKLFKWRTGCIRKRAAEGKRQGVSAYKALGKLDAC